MPRKTSAVDALRKLEADRETLNAKQRELERQVSLELGQVILGSGLEHFSRKGLRRVAEMLGAVGEQAALEWLSSKKPSRPVTADPASR